MQELSHDLVNLWDGVGLGGSQKCELATADETGLLLRNFIWGTAFLGFRV